MIFLILLLQIICAVLGEPWSYPRLFNLLVLGLSNIKLFICAPLSSDICFGYYTQKLNYVRGFLLLK